MSAKPATEIATAKAGTARKTTAFRRLLNADGLDFLLEAHNGITAKIVEEAGFPAIWAGGLCMSAQFGVRDSNEASWTQVLGDAGIHGRCQQRCRFCLTGTRVTATLIMCAGSCAKLEQRNIAAVCIEDKLFPKTNSFIDGKQTGIGRYR